MKWKQDQNRAFTFEKCVFDIEARADTDFESKEPPTVTQCAKKANQATSSEQLFFADL